MNKVFSSLTISSILSAKCLLACIFTKNNQPEVLSTYSHYKNIKNILLGSLSSFITHIQQVIKAVSESNLKGKYRLSPWPWKTHSCLHLWTQATLALKNESHYLHKCISQVNDKPWENISSSFKHNTNIGFHNPVVQLGSIKRVIIYVLLLLPSSMNSTYKSDSSIKKPLPPSHPVQLPVLIIVSFLP